MQSFTVWQVSDTHLSASHAYFQDNWDVFVDMVAEQRPDLVIDSGDLTFNGPEVADDLRFGRAQLDRLARPWLALPGNHDVGEPGKPRLDQPVTAARLAAWQDLLGPDCFAHDLGDWLLIGINCEVLGSGLAQEAAQWRHLEAALARRDGRPVGLYLHKPLFVAAPDEPRAGGMCVLAPVRERLLGLVESSGVRFVASGHLHCFAERRLPGTDCVWCPTTAFVDPRRARPPDATHRAGFVEWRFAGENFGHALVEPPLFVNLDISNWTHTSGTSIDMPPRPLYRQAPGERA